MSADQWDLALELKDVLVVWIILLFLSYALLIAFIAIQRPHTPFLSCGASMVCDTIPMLDDLEDALKRVREHGVFQCPSRCGSCGSDACGEIPLIKWRVRGVTHCDRHVFFWFTFHINLVWTHAIYAIESVRLIYMKKWTKKNTCLSQCGTPRTRHLMSGILRKHQAAWAATRRTFGRLPCSRTRLSASSRSIKHSIVSHTNEAPHERKGVWVFEMLWRQ